MGSLKGFKNTMESELNLSILLKLKRKKCKQFKKIMNKQEQLIKNQQAEIIHLNKIINLLKLDPIDNNPAPVIYQVRIKKALEIKKPKN